MSKYIDADMLEKDGWNMQRTRQISSTEMLYETKKPTDFPTADVEEVQHGRWTRYEYSTNNRWRKCSVCGRGDEYINEFGFVAIRNYCPYCGAKMVGGKENE